MTSDSLRDRIHGAIVPHPVERNCQTNALVICGVTIYVTDRQGAWSLADEIRRAWAKQASEAKK